MHVEYHAENEKYKQMNEWNINKWMNEIWTNEWADVWDVWANN